MIPFLDVGAAHAELRDEVERAVIGSIRSGQYIGGREVQAFEEAFARYTESRFCIGVANGLDALRLALVALGVAPGDEVIVPANTFIATWLAVSQCGAVPVAVDPDPVTYNIDAALIRRAISARTKVIVPVHLYGQPAALDEILNIAREHNIGVLEDAAQAHGARYKGRRVGSHGNVVAWSFYPSKNLGALGDGGALTTNDAEIAERVRALGNYGSSSKYVHQFRGYNSRLDPVQAAVLSVKLRFLDEWNARRTAIASRYSSAFCDTPVQAPATQPWTDHVYHLYVVQYAQRDALQRQLAEAGISTLIHYPIPPHLQEAYADRRYAKGQFPIAEEQARNVLSLPIGPHLPIEDVDKVIAAVKRAARI